MDQLKEYMAAGGRGLLPRQQYVESVVNEYPWFGMGRMLRCRITGVVDSLTGLSLYGRAVPRFFMCDYDGEDVMRRTDKEIIESFLRGGEHRIVPNESTPEYLEGVPYSETPSDRPVVMVAKSEVVAPLNVSCVEDEEDLIVEAECGEEQDDEVGAVADQPITEQRPATELVVSFMMEEDDEFVTEELAQIYLDQELYDQAKAIYNRLSLLNPEKSVYFAEIIDKIEVLKMSQEA